MSLKGRNWKATVLWTMLGLLIVVGVGQRIKGTPAPQIERYERKAVKSQSQAAFAYAERVVLAYLNWDPDDPTRRETRLKRLGASDTFTPSRVQVVTYVQADHVRSAGPNRSFVYVDTTLTTVGGERNVMVAVPVAASKAGKLGLFAQPTLLPAPKYPTRERVGVDDNTEPKIREAVTAAAESYFKLAATTNDASRLAYFAAEGTTLHGIAAASGSSFNGFDETQFETTGGGVNTYLAARIENPNGDELIGSYYLTFVQQNGRWLIKTQTP